MQIKILFNVPSYLETRGNLQPRPLRKSPTRALVSDDVNLGKTCGKIIALVLARCLPAGLRTNLHGPSK